MSHTLTGIIFEGPDKKAKAAFNKLQSELNLTLYRLLSARWAVFVHARESTTQWKESRHLAKQLSSTLGTALLEYYHSISGLHHELYRGGVLAFASRVGSQGQTGLEPAGEELLGAFPLRAIPRTIEDVREVRVWAGDGELIARSTPRESTAP